MIDTVPPATPVTTPPAETVAIVGSALPHAPPGVASVSVVVAPEHIGVVPPPIAAGVVFTVSVAVAAEEPQPFR